MLTLRVPSALKVNQMTKNIGSSFLLVLCSFFLFSSCESTREKETSLSALSSNGSKKNEENDFLTKFQNDYDLNKLTEVEVNEAFLVAKSYEYKGQFEKAENLFDIIYKFSPNIPAAFNLIQIKVNLKKVSEAKEIAKHAHVIFPKNEDILLMLIQIYQIEGNQVQVTHLLDEGVKQFPKNESFAILYAYYNRSDAKKILISFLAKSPSSPNVLLKLSTLYYAEKNYTESLKLAKKSYSLDSDNIDTITTTATITTQESSSSSSAHVTDTTAAVDSSNNDVKLPTSSSSKVAREVSDLRAQLEQVESQLLNVKIPFILKDE